MTEGSRPVTRLLVERVETLLRLGFRDEDYLTAGGIPMAAPAPVRRALRNVRAALAADVAPEPDTVNALAAALRYVELHPVKLGTPDEDDLPESVWHARVILEAEPRLTLAADVAPESPVETGVDHQHERYGPIGRTGEYCATCGQPLPATSKP